MLNKGERNRVMLLAKFVGTSLFHGSFRVVDMKLGVKVIPTIQKCETMMNSEKKVRENMNENASF